jgi:hypothetical protein
MNWAYVINIEIDDCKGLKLGERLEESYIPAAPSFAIVQFDFGDIPFK